MSIALVDHTAAYGNGAATLVTTPAIDTTLANLFIAAVQNYGASGSVTPVDSKVGNTWNPLTRYKAGSLASVQLFWCSPTSVGSGHTFGVTGDYCPIEVLAFSSANASPYDTGSDTGASDGASSSLQPGSKTPTVNGCLIVSACGSFIGSGSNPTIDGGFTATDVYQPTPGVSFGGGLAYLIQTTAAAANPTWTFGSPPGDCAVDLAIFTPAGAAAAVRGFVPLISRFAAQRASGY